MLADGVGTVWAGPDAFVSLTSLSWDASPLTPEFDVTSALNAILCVRPLSLMQLSPEDERMAVKVVVDYYFVRRVLEAMAALPISSVAHGMASWCGRCCAAPPPEGLPQRQ